MNAIATEILIILLLLAANGLFAMTEIAVVSARKARLRRLAEETGDLKAKAALELAQSPNRFLATVQVGITLVGVLAGAFGGATLAEEIATTCRPSRRWLRMARRSASGRSWSASPFCRSSWASWCRNGSG